MTDEDEIFGLDDQLPAWTVDDVDDIPDEPEDEPEDEPQPFAPVEPGPLGPIE